MIIDYIGYAIAYSLGGIVGFMTCAVLATSAKMRQPKPVPVAPTSGKRGMYAA